jgi:hypothetical protein
LPENKAGIAIFGKRMTIIYIGRGANNEQVFLEI